MQTQPSAAKLAPEEVKAKLWQLEEQMWLLIEHTPAAIAVCDRQMRYLLVSRRWLEDYRLGDRDIIGCSHYEIFPEIPDSWKAIHQRCLAGAIERRDQEAFLRADGTVDWLKWEIRPWHDDAGEVGGLMMFTEVITQRKQAELTTQHVRAELEAKVEVCTADLQQAVAQLRQMEKQIEALQQSETVYRTLVENSSDCVCHIGLDGNLLYMNQGGVRLNELESVSQVYGEDCAESIQPEHRKQMATALERARHGEATKLEYVSVTAKGNELWWEGIINAIKDEQGCVISLLRASRNINDQKQAEASLKQLNESLEKQVRERTAELQQVIQRLEQEVSDRKRAEAQLSEQEQFLRSIYDGVECHLFVVDVSETNDFLYASYNKASEQAVGIRSQDIAGKTPEQVFGPVEGAIVRQIFTRCVETGTAITEEERLTFKGEETWSLATFNPLRNQDGRIYRIVGTAIDITNLKRIEAALQQALQETEYQSRLLRTVIDATPDWIFAKDAQFRYILVNQSYATDLGRTVEDLLGKDDLELGFAEELVFGNPEKGIRGFRTDDQAALAGEPVHNPADPATVADGSLHIFDARKMPLSDQTGTIFAVLGVSHDLTERHQTEAALRRSQIQLKEKAEQLEQALQRLQRTQARLIQNEKMSSLGQLVAGVTHEINNPVSFIYGNLPYADDYIQSLLRLLTLYQQHYPNPARTIQDEANAIDFHFLMEDLPKLLGSMKVGADRIQKIVASLRTFSRMDETNMQTIDLHEVMDSTLTILQNRFKATDNRPEIAVIKHYSTLPPVECCTGQLNQVFMNILSNAIDAIEEGVGNGERERENQQTSHPTPCIWIRTELMNPKYVKISITDSGPGIPVEVQQRLFDPFFTTKPVGKGTGMGLSICYQIVTEKHRGSIYCVSEPGQGAEFIIQIPMRQS